MNEFIEKLIGRLEGREKYYHECALDEIMENGHTLDAEGFLGKEDAYGDVLSIVNQLAEGYKDKTMIDGQYCWQTCGATEHCKECNRLCNGSIDYYENYDCLAEEYKEGAE